jgi:PAS domain S-box-containing protein
MSAEIPGSIVQFFSESQVPLVLCDPNLRDDPMILVNAEYCRVTGYMPAELLGKNCRLLQGKGTQNSVRLQLRDALSTQRDTHVLIRNYRKNGEAFDNFLNIFTIFDAQGRALYRIGSLFDVPATNKTTSFENHSRQLRSGIERLNLETAAARKQMMRLVDVVGLTVKELLHARLEILKHQV